METNTWYDGTGLPQKEIGKDGDYYLRVDSGDIFKKNFHVWERIGNIRGAVGPQGPDGKPGRDVFPGRDGVSGQRGSVWYDGVGTPSKRLGEIQDYFLDLRTGDIYKKTTSLNWERVGNMKGIQGATGKKGEQGIQGEKGEQGIQGEKGEQGIQGEKGEQGIQGEKGKDGKDADLTNLFKLFPNYLWACFGSSKQIIKFDKKFNKKQIFNTPEGSTPKSITFYNGRCFYTANKLYELNLPNLTIKNSKQILSDERGYQGVAFGKVEGKETLLIAGSSRAMGHKFFKVNPDTFEIIEEFLTEKEYISDLEIIDGFLYYVLGSHIVKYDIIKKQEISRKSFDYGGRLYGLADVNGTIYISEYKNNQIHKLDRELNVIESHQVDRMPFGLAFGINTLDINNETW